jgi:hypothetical protein
MLGYYTTTSVVTCLGFLNTGPLLEYSVSIH